MIYDDKTKVGGLGVAPLGLEEFTRWCPQRVVSLQRRSKVTFPTSWGSLKGSFKEETLKTCKRNLKTGCNKKA